MANEFVARKGLIVSGSTIMTGSLNVSRGITGSLFGTSSWASNVISASFAQTASAITGSLQIIGMAEFTEGATVSGGLYILTTDSTATNKPLILNTSTGQIHTTASVFATTTGNTFVGNQVITGSLTVSSSAVVELRVIGDTELTGSLRVSSAGITGSLFGTSSWASNAISSSFATSASWAPGGGGAAFPYDGTTTPAIITGSLIVSGSGITVTGSTAMQTYSLTTSSLGNASGSMSISLTNANYFTAVGSASTVWSFNNPQTNRSVGFVLTYTSGGAITNTWPTTVRWPNGSAPVLTPSGGVDVLTFITDNSGVTWRGVLSMVNSR